MLGGDLGEVRLVHGHYLQDWLFYDTDYNWRLEPELGGTSRAVADIGSHWCDLVQFITGKSIDTIWPGTVAKFGTERPLWTVPIVAYGIYRYLYLVGVSQQAEDPSSVLLHDRPIGATVVLYLAAVLAILYWR